MLQQHGMLAAAAHVRHLRGELGAALALHLLRPDRAAAFAYMQRCVEGGRRRLGEGLLVGVLDGLLVRRPKE
jgi:hypothetical protein